MSLVLVFTVGAVLAPAQSATLPTTPTPVDRGKWIDYPAVFSYFGRRKFEGVVGYRLEVAPDGKPRNCTITASSGQPKLDSLTCSFLLDRARFFPARDAGGQPIALAYDNHITYQSAPDVSVPMPVPLLFQQKHESGTADMRLRYKDGHAAECKITTSTGFRDLDDYSCAHILSQNLPPPPHWDSKTVVIELRWGEAKAGGGTP